MHLGRVVLLHHNGIVARSLFVALAVGLVSHFLEHFCEHSMIHLHTLEHASEVDHHLLHEGGSIGIGHHTGVGCTETALGSLVLGKHLL